MKLTNPSEVDGLDFPTLGVHLAPGESVEVPDPAPAPVEAKPGKASRKESA